MRLALRAALASLALLRAGEAALAKLRIGMFWQTALPWFQRDPITGQYYAGFLIDFYKEMGYVGNFEIEFVPIKDGDFLSNFTAVSQRLLREGTIDVAWSSDVNQPPGFSYTSAMFRSEQGVITRRTRAQRSTWQVFAPFKTELWASIVVSMLLGALLLSALSKTYSDQNWKETAFGFPSYFYHTWAALLGGDEYDLYHVPPLGRLYRLGLLFFVLVSTATYTANLAAFLTRPQFEVHGPKTMGELAKSTVCVRWPQFVREPSYFGKLVIPPADMSPTDRGTWAREKLFAGECDAIVDSKASLKPESLQFCNELHLNQELGFLYSSVYNVLAESRAALALQISEAVLRTRTLPKYYNMVAQNMRYGASCPNLQVAEDTAQISVKQMGPVFSLFGWCCVLSLAITGCQRLCNNGKALAVARAEVKNEGLDGKLNVVLDELSSLKMALQPKQVVI